MSDLYKSHLNWDIQLNFDNLEITKDAVPLPPKIPPRQIIGEKFPKILTRIELLWGTLELHNYLEHTLFTDRSNRHGFPEDVLKALGEIHNEHIWLLKQKNMISVDIWDINK
ncbi:MAG: hypothetical protein HZB47_10045 [Nitrosomonadales bacterium]|nr:hypothetical protein [Nitrosomonadales bacterium]